MSDAVSGMSDEFPTSPFEEKMAQIRANYENYREAHSEADQSDLTMKLFRNIFGAYPCYRENHGEFGSPVRISDSDHVQAILQCIRDTFSQKPEDLRVVKVAKLNFDRILPNYNPQTRVYLTSAEATDFQVDDEDYDGDSTTLNFSGMTIMQVVERVDAGAPNDAVTLYMWPGGKEYYNDPEKNAELESVTSNERVITFDNPYNWPAQVPEPHIDDIDPMEMIG